MLQRVRSQALVPKMLGSIFAFPFSSSASFELTKHKIKQWKGKGGDSLRVDLSIILHHIIIFLLSAYLFCSLPYPSPSHSSSLTPFLFEVSYLVCILGPFAEQTNSSAHLLRGFLFCVHLGLFAVQENPSAFPLRGFLSCVHLGAFRKASKFKRPSSSKIPMFCAS